MFANFRKNLNSIMEIKDQNGVSDSSHDEVVEARKSFFSSLFKKPEGCLITENINVVDIFPRSISEEINESLHEEILKGEIISTLSVVMSLSK